MTPPDLFKLIKKKVGGGEGTRTPDFLLAKQALSQLSYTPLTDVIYYTFFLFF
tara:strand:+ start:8853 stop:9011 length:159 start_codon:yes stop_codon:yes gene_type:complete